MAVVRRINRTAWTKRLTSSVTSNDNTATTTVVTSKPVLDEESNSSFKYWKMRFNLFSKFTDGVMLDRVSFYSVCPEILSEHIAERCRFDVALDPFCGAGGNAIQLALKCRKVIAVDIDPNKIKLAKRNAEIYGVDDKITFYVGDFFRIGTCFKADVLVTSPPWGGPSYSQKNTFSVKNLCESDGGGVAIMRIARKIAPRIVLHLPKNMDKNEYSRLGGRQFELATEIEECFINHRPNCVTVYYGKFTARKTYKNYECYFTRKLNKEYYGQPKETRSSSYKLTNVSLNPKWVSGQKMSQTDEEEYREYLTKVDIFLQTEQL